MFYLGFNVSFSALDMNLIDIYDVVDSISSNSKLSTDINSSQSISLICYFEPKFLFITFLRG